MRKNCKEGEKRQRESKRRRGEERDGEQEFTLEIFLSAHGFWVFITPIQGGRRQGGGEREREKKNERERKDREAQRESNGFKVELFELNIFDLI